ncbi:sigma factor-like helix-turn-helix DNA-binding protein [Paradesulfitobacterium ferrireducens]|uniref:sigma factor-like helix-turn-helix DNA-binding protein n=1 Tax=Paradesulfitobacterium ferrireducens TaxID=2816476 RepID=UPI001A909C15|nr:sigma factor-like helix-turn-helix DNA-binding protein [Paradesulfitobacterium ferrireducens]
MHLEIRGLEKLSFRERQAVMLKESGQSLEQIGKRLRLSPSSVATLLARAKNKGYEIVCIIPGGELGLEGEDTFDEETD